MTYTEDFKHILAKRDQVTNANLFVFKNNAPRSIKVFPEEVEVVLAKSPMVEEVLVYSDIIKTGSKQGNEEIVAKIHPKKDVLEQYQDDKELEKALRNEVKKLSLELSSYKRPNIITVTREPLPRTGISKVSRKNVKVGV